MGRGLDFLGCPMSALTNPRKCVHCKSIFLADRRNLRHQLFCSQGACRAESKRQAQRRWLSKDANCGYFQGSAAVERVRAWRAGHPGYSRGRGKRSPVALQDDCETQVTDEKGVTEDLFGDALQDLCRVQTPLLVGLISQTLGSALQEDIVQHVARLVAKGQDLMDAPSRTAAQNPLPVQLAGSPAHPPGPAP